MSDRSALTTRRVRAIDAAAIAAGVPGLILMENAALRAADVARAEIVARGLAGAWVLAGAGNNGGDGLGVARHLVNAGINVVVDLTIPESRLAATPDAMTNLVMARACDVHVVTGRSPDVALMAVRDAMPRFLVVDALLGTGVRGDVRSPTAEWIDAANACDMPILAVDVPSGLDADTGAVLGRAVRADLTVTFVAAKCGFLHGAGPECVGRLVVVAIGVPRRLLQDVVIGEDHSGG